MKKLIRKQNSSIGGVCSGIGEYIDIDTTIIRIICVAGIFTPFPTILTYFALWIIIPKEAKIKFPI